MEAGDSLRILRWLFGCLEHVIVITEFGRRWSMNYGLSILIQFRCWWLLYWWRSWAFRCFWRCVIFLWLGISSIHNLSGDFIHRPLNQVLVIGLCRPLLNLRYLELWHIYHRLLRLTFSRRLLSRCRWRLSFCGSCGVLLLLFNPLQFFDPLFLLVLL